MSETTKCPRCGKPQPPDSVHTCSPRRPDARPVGETAELACNAEGDAECVLKGAIVGYGECESALQDASWKTVVLPRLYAYRDACKAEARAALLRDAPVVWVAREDPRLGADAKPDPYKRVILSRDLGDLLNLAPGECARVRITKLDEEPTRT